MYYNEESEKYETKINITTNTNAGKFFISYIEVVDTNGNYTKGTVGIGGRIVILLYIGIMWKQRLKSKMIHKRQS